MHGYGWIFQIVILVLFFIVLWWMLRSSQQFGYRTDESAEEILKRRLASGELSIGEYKKLMKEIHGDRQ